MADTALTVSDGARIAYHLDGPADAPVLVLSNSLGTTMDMWRGQLLTFTKSFRVLRYDSRGHGRSSDPDGEYTIARLSIDVIELLDSLGMETVHFCGLSMGGMVGQWLGAHKPERISSLALCNTSARMEPENWRRRIELVRQGGMHVIADQVIDRWFTPAFIAAEPAAVGRVRDMLLAMTARGYIGCCAAIRDMDQRKTAGTIQAPCLVVGGAEDHATPLCDSEWLARSIPGAALSLLNAAHMSNIECCTSFTDLIHGFLAAVSCITASKIANDLGRLALG